MSNLSKIDSMLRNQDFPFPHSGESIGYDYAAGIAAIENAVVVVSDLKNGTSRIFCGGFAKILGVEGYQTENSIWERTILQLMDEKELERKYISEIRFFNFIRKQPKGKRSRYYLIARLRFRVSSGMTVDVTHRMFYQYTENGSVRYGICIYGPMIGKHAFCSQIINSLTGETMELDHTSDNSILSRRETQVLQLIDRGKTSSDIAGELSISRYTVSRHRQEILAKLQVRNSTEACRMARQLGII